MEEQDFLQTIAQAALGIAGFTGVMSAFMKRPGRLTTVEIFRVATLLGVSFGAMFLALLPPLLALFGLDGRHLWGSASVVMAAYSTVAVPTLLISAWHVSRQAPEIFNRYIFGGIVLGHLFNIGLQIVNATLASEAVRPGIYIIGLLWYLVHAAVQFPHALRAARRPLLTRGDAVLDLRPTCENCNKALPPGSHEARICSYECTFCAACVDAVLGNVCPNCGGGFTARPVRPAKNWKNDNFLGKHPATTKVTHKPVDAAAHARFSAAIRALAPERR